MRLPELLLACITCHATYTISKESSLEPFSFSHCSASILENIISSIVGGSVPQTLTARSAFSSFVVIFSIVVCAARKL